MYSARFRFVKVEGCSRRGADLPTDTSILDPQLATAQKLVALYHERWEIGVSSQGHIFQLVRD